MAAPLALPSAARGRASELVDALPYIDPLTDSQRAEVDALIAAEARKGGGKTVQDHLRELPAVRPAEESPFVKGHPLVLREYERVAAGQAMPALDPSRYRLDPPPEAQRADPLAWLAALRNARAQLGHQRGRVLNLELLARHGAAAWRAHADFQSSSARALEREASRLSAEVVAGNRRRKLQQVAAGGQLGEAEGDWWRALGGVAAVATAGAAVEAEVLALAAAARAEGRVADAERAEGAVEEARRLAGDAGAVAARGGENENGGRGENESGEEGAVEEDAMET